MTNTIQKKFKVSSTQLLYQSCPYQALTLFVTGPFLDGFLTNRNVFAFDYTPQVLVRYQFYFSALANFKRFGILFIWSNDPEFIQHYGTSPLRSSLPLATCGLGS